MASAVRKTSVAFAAAAAAAAAPPPPRLLCPLCFLKKRSKESRTSRALLRICKRQACIAHRQTDSQTPNTKNLKTRSFSPAIGTATVCAALLLAFCTCLGGDSRQVFLFHWGRREGKALTRGRQVRGEQRFAKRLGSRDGDGSCRLRGGGISSA